MDSRTRTHVLLAMLIATSIGCGRNGLGEEVFEPTTGAAGSGPPKTVALPAGVAPVAYVPVTKTISECWEPAGQPYEPASVSETVSLLVGRWLACGGATDPIGPTVGHQGMELGRDRRWRALDLVGGMLVEVVGFGSEGLWYLSPEDPKDMFRLDRALRVKPEGKGAGGFHVDFLQDPTRLLTSDGTVFVWQGE